MREDNVKFTGKLTIYEILSLNYFYNCYKTGKFLSKVVSPSFTLNAIVPFY